MFVLFVLLTLYIINPFLVIVSILYPLKTPKKKFVLVSLDDTKCEKLHCGEIARIRSFSGPYFPTFGLNIEER